MSYTTEQKIENYTLTDIDDSFSGQIDDWIESAESYIDNYTGRNFEATTQTRYYSGSGSREMLVDDMTSVDTIKVAHDQYGEDQTTLETDDYILIPKDYQERNEPITTIFLKDNYWVYGVNNHEITGDFGYSDNAPDDVELAATILVSVIIKQHKASDITGKDQEKIGDYTISYDTDSDVEEKLSKVKGLLDPYKSVQI